MFKFIDCVHGEINLPKYVEEVVATKEFQRLRNIRQLGVSNYYYEKANHARFEHSIGTAYLCNKILDTIEGNSDLKIDENHRKCVVLAGLLHDLGHGPYSHLWENVVRKGGHTNWTHEDQSVKMIYHMINSNNIQLHEDQQTHDTLVELTCSLITGDFDVWKRLLKPSNWFITEIVSNKLCNIDVDKFDYLLRDFQCVGFELKPFVEFLNRARVVTDHEDVTHVGFHVDDFNQIENLFINRANYHMEVYQSPHVAGIEKQFRDICFLASSAGFEISGTPMCEIQESCEKYCQLDDRIVDLIVMDSNPKLKKAQELIKNLQKKNFYSMIYETKDMNEVNDVLDKLICKFGDIFCTVEKHIPNAKVPDNVPLYDDDGNNVQKISNQKLDYKSTMIFCKQFNPTTIQNICNFLNNNDM